jgi:ABC-type nitrate/sulfonate/bicarbonate transport system substrate-binding protein
MSFRRGALLPVLTVGLLGACTDTAAKPESSTTLATTPATTPATSTSTSVATDDTIPVSPVAGGAVFPVDRCDANKAAGKITYLTCYDYAASASIVDVLVAAQKGYYKDLCLDVTVKSSTSTDNYKLVAADEAQFASGGSFAELVGFAGQNDAGFVALAVEGRTGIDSLITKDGEVPTLAAIKGKKLGVQKLITPEVKAMLASAGLVEGTDYETVPLASFDPKVNLAIPDIVGFGGFKSNEPKQLEAAKIPFKLYDPSDFGVPGTFGVLYTNSTFLDEFPTAAEDFMRATMRGLTDAIADPAAAVKASIDQATAGGNPFFLSEEGEKARWAVESKVVSQGVTPTAPAGVLLPDDLQKEITTYAKIGLFEGQAPDIATMIKPNLVAGVYDKAGKVIWPSP